TGGFWSAYWHQGRIYGSEIVRGLDVLELLPSEHLSDNELAAARLAKVDGAYNPQQQHAVRWPAESVVARAYIDQLQRGGHASLAALLARVEHALTDGAADTGLAALAVELAEQARDHEGSTRQRLVAL